MVIRIEVENKKIFVLNFRLEIYYYSYVGVCDFFYFRYFWDLAAAWVVPSAARDSRCCRLPSRLNHLQPSTINHGRSRPLTVVGWTGGREPSHSLSTPQPRLHLARGCAADHEDAWYAASAAWIATAPWHRSPLIFHETRDIMHLQPTGLPCCRMWSGCTADTGVHYLRRVQRCYGHSSAMSSLGGDCTPLAAHRRRRLN